MTHDEKIVEAVATAEVRYDGYEDLLCLSRTMRERYLDRARAAITAFQAEAWQPIETAPKERGAKILGWCVYPAGAEVRLCQNAPAYTSVPGATRWEAYGMSQQVTHWQPLPPAPKATP